MYACMHEFCKDTVFCLAYKKKDYLMSNTPLNKVIKQLHFSSIHAYKLQPKINKHKPQIFIQATCIKKGMHEFVKKWFFVLHVKKTI